MGLIAHYQLNDLSAMIGDDLVYKNNSGNLQLTPGKLGQGYRRSAINTGTDYLESKQIVHLNRSFTMACWAFVTHAGSSANGLVTNHNHGLNAGAGITVRRIDADDYRISCNTGTGSSRTYHTYHGTSNIKDRWAHLVVRYDHTTQELSLWVDGGQEYVRTYAMFCLPDHIAIHSWSTGYHLSNNYRPGATIDDVRVYDHALSKREIQHLARGLLHHFPLRNTPHDALNSISAGLVNGSIVSDAKGDVADVRGGEVVVDIADLDLKLKGESIAFWQKSEFPRANAGGGEFSNWLIHWGTYYGPNSGGVGLHSGNVAMYLRGPNSSGWTNADTQPQLNDLYDTHDWIHWVVVFTEDDRFKVYANGQLYINIALSQPNTGLTSKGVRFGTIMQAYVSDVRFYATELTGETIQQMYANVRTLDPNGTLHGWVSEIKAVEEYPVPFGTAHSGDFGLRFTVNKPIKIKTAVIHPYFTGAAIARLYDFNDQTQPLQETPLTLIGNVDQQVTLDFDCVPGVNYWMMIPAGFGKIQRTEAVVDFPIESGPITFTTSSNAAGPSADSNRWYYFFDFRYAELDVGSVFPQSDRLSEVHMSQGLICWQRLYGQLRDLARYDDGNPLNVTLTPEGTLFDKSTSVVEIANLPISNGEFSIAFWVKPHNNGQFAAIVDQGTVNGAVTGFTIAIDWRANRQQSLQWRDPTSGVTDVFAGFFTGRSGIWTHVTLTFSEGELTAYRDGDSVGVVSMAGPGNAPIDASLGLRPSTGFGLSGLLRDFRVYNRRLNDLDVMRLHALTAPSRPSATVVGDTLSIQGRIIETAG